MRYPTAATSARQRTRSSPRLAPFDADDGDSNPAHPHLGKVECATQLRLHPRAAHQFGSRLVGAPSSAADEAAESASDSSDPVPASRHVGRWSARTNSGAASSGLRRARPTKRRKAPRTARIRCRPACRWLLWRCSGCSTAPPRRRRGGSPGTRPAAKQQPARGSVQDVGGFCGGVAGVQRHHRGAGVVDRQERGPPRSSRNWRHRRGRHELRGRWERRERRTVRSRRHRRRRRLGRVRDQELAAPAGPARTSGPVGTAGTADCSEPAAPAAPPAPWTS